MDVMKIYESYKQYVPLAALIVALIALISSLLLWMNINSLVQQGIQAAVATTKVRIAELEAAAKLTNARATFIAKKDYQALESTLNEIAGQTAQVYAQSDSSTRPQWNVLKTLFDELIVLADTKNEQVVEKMDNLIAILRTDAE